MAWVALASAAVSLLGSLKQGQAAKDTANYQAAQADADASAARSAAKVEAARIRKAGASQASQANAALAASGVETGEGTALRITSDITGDAEQDAYTTIMNGMNTGARYNAQAQADRISGKNAAQASYINAGSSLLQGGSAAYSGWRKSNPSPAASTASTGASSNNMFSNMGIR